MDIDRMGHCIDDGCSTKEDSGRKLKVRVKRSIFMMYRRRRYRKQPVEHIHDIQTYLLLIITLAIVALFYFVYIHPRLAN
jgi:hypothetical protein